MGNIATGILATKVINTAGADGLIHGNPRLFFIQIKAIIITMAWILVYNQLWPFLDNR